MLNLDDRYSNLSAHLGVIPTYGFLCNFGPTTKLFSRGTRDAFYTLMPRSPAFLRSIPKMWASKAILQNSMTVCGIKMIRHGGF